MGGGGSKVKDNVGEIKPLFDRGFPRSLDGIRTYYDCIEAFVARIEDTTSPLLTHLNNTDIKNALVESIRNQFLEPMKSLRDNIADSDYAFKSDPVAVLFYALLAEASYYMFELNRIMVLFVDQSVLKVIDFYKDDCFSKGDFIVKSTYNDMIAEYMNYILNSFDEIGLKPDYIQKIIDDAKDRMMNAIFGGSRNIHTAKEQLVEDKKKEIYNKVNKQITYIHAHVKQSHETYLKTFETIKGLIEKMISDINSIMRDHVGKVTVKAREVIAYLTALDDHVNKIINENRVAGTPEPPEITKYLGLKVLNTLTGYVDAKLIKIKKISTP